MSRRFGWAMLVAFGMALGCALSSFRSAVVTSAAAQESAADDRDASVADQLKDIRTQVKEINTLLHSGTIKVVVVLNPDKM